MASGDQANTSRKNPPGKKAKKLSQKEQSERFIETARTLEVDENQSIFERVFNKIVKPRHKSGD